MKYNIITEKAGVISEHAFKLVLIANPTPLMLDLASWSMGGFSFWGDTVAIDFHERVPDELIEQFLDRFEENEKD